MTATCRPWLPARATTRRRGAAVALRAGPAARTRATVGAIASAARGRRDAAGRREARRTGRGSRAEAPVADIAEERRARKDAIKSDNAGRRRRQLRQHAGPTAPPSRPRRPFGPPSPRRQAPPPPRRRRQRRHGRFRRRHAGLHADRRQGLRLRAHLRTMKTAPFGAAFAACADRDRAQVSGESWISTRRLSARPSAVPFVAMGRVGPKPVTAKRRESTPCWLR